MTDESNIDRRWETAVDAARKGDKAGALYLLKALARDGVQAAFREIANILESGGGGVTKDIEDAITWYRKAVDEANDAHACIGLARIYYYGKTGQPDYEKALWYLRLVDNKGFPLVDMLLGRMHLSGHGVDASLKQARLHFQKAAATGNVFAKKELAILDIKHGNIFRGTCRLLSAAFQAMRIGAKSIYDPRLKNI